MTSFEAYVACQSLSASEKIKQRLEKAPQDLLHLIQFLEWLLAKRITRLLERRSTDGVW